MPTRGRTGSSSYLSTAWGPEAHLFPFFHLVPALRPVYIYCIRNAYPRHKERDLKERHNRLAVVKELIKNNRIDNQDTLLELLKQEGFNVTQATLSRDLKMLKVGKISDGWSGYYYALPESDLISESEKSYIQDVRRGILSIEFSGNFGVIKTRPGHANSVCFALDVLNLPEILGSLAGDDTIFVILREGMTKEDLLESFQTRIPDIQE